MANPFKKLLGKIQKSGVPAKLEKGLVRTEQAAAREADEILGPELAQAMSRNADEIIDVTPKVRSELPSSNKLKKLVTIGAPLAIGGSLLLGDDQEEQVEPVAPIREPNMTPVPKEESKKSVSVPAAKKANVVPKPIDSGAKKDDTVSKSPELPMTLDFGDGFKDTEAALADAQERQRQAILVNQLAKAGELIGSSISGTKPIAQQAFDENVKQAGNIVKEHEALMEKAKNDPNSPLSKGMRQFMSAFGFNVQGDASAEELMKLSPLAERYYNHVENREVREMEMRQRAEDRKLAREQIKANKDIALAEREKRDLENFTTKERDRVNKSKPYQNFQTAIEKANQIEAAVRNPSGFKDVASIYAFMKSLDPESVVRESEYATAASVGGLRDRIENAISRQVSGQTLTDDQRQELLAIAQQMRQVSGESYSRYSAPVIRAAKRRGARLDEIFDNAEQIEKFHVDSEKRAAGQGPTDMVKVKLPDGQMGTIPRANLESFMKDFPGSREIE